ncbi:MAG: HAD family hydrolase [Nitrososphaerota archaeon]|nr:HAD family hydrolase [Nitrososphaerota archaeon]MDG7010766.1 HAD family hydrolase [Nitrososphaerota archaeon]
MVVGVVFDIDGTLVTFRFDVRGARKALIDELRRQGYDTGGLDLGSPTQRILDSAREQSAAGRGTGYDALRKAVFAILDAFEVESSATTTILPGVRQVLDSLRSRGVRLGVLSNSGRRSALAALGKAGLLDCFEFVLTRDDTELMKPRPEGLEMAAAKFGLPKGSVFYVGDSAFDVHAAKAAGIRVVSVATGNYTAERLKSEGADYTISALSELGAVLGV